MAQMTFLNLLSHAKVCSHDMVFVDSEIVLTTSGLYFVLHLLSLWFLMCSSSIILVMSCQMYLWSPGNGSGSLATFRLSRCH